MTFFRRRRSGFTIVEMLVVVGIIALLMGLLLPALAGAKKKARKAREMNNLRQVGLAWMMYANQNDDAVPPGFMETEVQERWKVSYEFPDRSKIPPAPEYANENIAGPWTWRLMPFLDYNHEIIHGYLEETDPSVDELINEEAEPFSQTPAFGYNAYYVGGWWRMEPGSDGTPVPRAKFSVDEDGKARALVARSIGTIRRGSELIVFASSAWREHGLYRREKDDHLPGAHYVTPPWVADVRVWGPAGAGTPAGSAHGGGSGHGAAGVNISGDPYAIGAFFANTIDTELIPAPVGRYTGAVAFLAADGHTATQTPGGLQDARLWINAADADDYRHDR